MLTRRDHRPAIAAFGPFVVNVVTGDVTAHGIRVHLQDKPFQVLVRLIERNGQTVTRGELCDLLWRENHFVEFDHNLNNVLRKLREALCDSIEKPAYIETVPRKGYRFIGHVSWIAPVESCPTVEPQIQESSNGASTLRLDSTNAPVIRERFTQARIEVAVIGLLLCAIVGIRWTRKLSANPSGSHPAMVKTQLLFPADVKPITRSFHAGVRFSPDGKSFVFSAPTGPGGKSSLWMRRMDSLDVEPISGTDGGSFPFWSPDGRFIGFFTAFDLRVLDRQTSKTMILADADSPCGGSWSSNGAIVAALKKHGPLYVVGLNGEPPRALRTAEDDSSFTHCWPEFLPDGVHLTFLASFDGSNQQPAMLLIGSTQGEISKVLTDADSNGLPVADRLLYVRQGKLVSQLFDPQSESLRSSSQILADDVDYDSVDRYGSFAATPAMAIYCPRSENSPLQQIAWFDRWGGRQRNLDSKGEYSSVSVAPHRGVVAMLDKDLPSSLQLVYPDGRKLDLHASGRITTAVWSSSGTEIAYSQVSDKSGYQIIEARTDIEYPEQKILTSRPSPIWPLDWDPSNRQLLTAQELRANNPEISLFDFESNKVTQCLPPTYGLHTARLSPDGHWIAYDAAYDGKREVFLASYPNPSIRYRVTFLGATSPRWSADGNSIYYIGSKGMLVRAELQTTRMSIKFKSAHEMFQLPFGYTAWSADSYDLAGDGSRILATTSSGPTQSFLVLLNNWR